MILQNQIHQYSHEINKNLPFILPLRLELPQKISLDRFNDDFQVLSPDMLLIKIISNMHSWTNFVVQRSQNKEGFHKSVFTLATSLYLLNKILKKNYVCICMSVCGHEHMATL